MKTNDFNALPLLQVGMRLAFDGTTQPHFAIPARMQFAMDLVNALKEHDIEGSLDDMFMPEPVPGQRIVEQRVTDRPFQIYFHDNLTLKVQSTMVSLIWDRSSKRSYPRFEATLPIMEKVIQSMQDLLGSLPTLRIANMHYLNELRSDRHHADPWAYLAPRLRTAPIAHGSQVITSRTIWKVSRSIDVQVELEAADDENQGNEVQPFLLRTSAGKLLAGDSPSAALVEVHDLLNDLFPTIISKEAVKEWQLNA